MTSVTYIVSAFNRPHALRCCLASIQCQTDGNFEVIVADNGATSPTVKGPLSNWKVWVHMAADDSRIRYIHTAAEANSPGWDCYHSAEWVVENANVNGEYICLPSDDTYLTPVFQETLLRVARANDLGLVYCDMLYDRRGNGKYHHKVVAPRVCEIDKTCFMLRRDCWIGFPNKPQTLMSSSCDGEMIEELVRRGIKHGRVDEQLVVHN